MLLGLTSMTTADQQEYQVMVANGGNINFSRKCHNIKLTMGEYIFNIPMLYIPMGGVDVVLGVQRLQYLGTISFNFQECFLKFFWEEKEVELRGITGKLGNISGSNGMKNILRKDKNGVIAQLCTLDVQTSNSCISPNLQKVLENN